VVSDGTRLREEFLLDPSVTFLNHGSFGATPRAVFETYQEWQLELERQPVLFLARRLEGLLAEARAALGAYVGAGSGRSGVRPERNGGCERRRLAAGTAARVTRSTDLEYDALDLTWEHVCRDFGARYVRTPIRLPIASPKEVIEAVWAGVGPRTRAPFLSHHTSTTAMTLPVEVLSMTPPAAFQSTSRSSSARRLPIFSTRTELFLGSIVEQHFVGTDTANGNTLSETDSYVEHFDAQGGDRLTGLSVHIGLLGGRVVIRDAGNLQFDADGNVVFVRGPTRCSRVTPPRFARRSVNTGLARRSSGSAQHRER